MAAAVEDLEVRRHAVLLHHHVAGVGGDGVERSGLHVQDGGGEDLQLDGLIGGAQEDAVLEFFDRGGGQGEEGQEARGEGAGQGRGAG
ncbi:MAG: hypothetical protein ACOC3I_04355 [Verrucomicrobiota bacterium]